MFCKRKTVLLRPRNEVLSYQRRKQEKQATRPALYTPFAINFEGVEKGGGGGKHRGRLVNSIRKKTPHLAPACCPPLFWLFFVFYVKAIYRRQYGKTLLHTRPAQIRL